MTPAEPGGVPWVAPLAPDRAGDAARRSGVPHVLSRLSVFRVLLAREPVARATADLLLSLLSGQVVPARLRELVIMRIAWTTGSAYEWAQHWAIATDLGVEPAGLLAVREGPDHPGFSPLERAALAAVDQCRHGGAVSPGTMTTLRDHLEDDALVELITAIATWGMLSTVLRSLEVPLEDGVAPWPPDGVAPWPPGGSAPSPDGVAP